MRMAYDYKAQEWVPEDSPAIREAWRSEVTWWASMTSAERGDYAAWENVTRADVEAGMLAKALSVGLPELLI